MIPPLFAFGIRFAISPAILFVVYFLHESPYKREAICCRQCKDSLKLEAALILCGQGLFMSGAQYLSVGATALLSSTIQL
jgi:hypothetical protein